MWVKIIKMFTEIKLRNKKNLSIKFFLQIVLTAFLFTIYFSKQILTSYIIYTDRILLLIICIILKTKVVTIVVVINSFVYFSPHCYFCDKSFKKIIIIKFFYR